MKKILLLATMLLSVLVYGEQINYVPAEFEVQRDQTYDKNGKFAYLCQFRQHYDEKTHSGSNYPAIFFDVMMPSQGFMAGTYTVADGGLVEATSAKGSTFRLTSNWQDGMAVEQVEREASVVKTIENGQLVIRRGDKRFGVLGNSCE